jgi:hypothetical protein
MPKPEVRAVERPKIVIEQSVVPVPDKQSTNLANNFPLVGASSPALGPGSALTAPTGSEATLSMSWPINNNIVTSTPDGSSDLRFVVYTQFESVSLNGADAEFVTKQDEDGGAKWHRAFGAFTKSKSYQVLPVSHCSAYVRDDHHFNFVVPLIRGELSTELNDHRTSYVVAYHPRPYKSLRSVKDISTQNTGPLLVSDTTKTMLCTISKRLYSIGGYEPYSGFYDQGFWVQFTGADRGLRFGVVISSTMFNKSHSQLRIVAVMAQTGFNPKTPYADNHTAVSIPIKLEGLYCIKKTAEFRSLFKRYTLDAFKMFLQYLEALGVPLQ